MNNVLIIEDDKEICVMIKDHLEKYNYQVFFTLISNLRKKLKGEGCRIKTIWGLGYRFAK